MGQWLLAVVDADTGYLAAVPVPSKEVSDYHVACLKTFVLSLFHAKCHMRSDNESSIVVLVEKVVAALHGLVKHDISPVYRSQSNGSAENTPRRIDEQTRTLRLATEREYGVKVLPDTPLWSWMVRHSGFLLCRFARNASGTTAFHTAFGHHYTGEVLPFAEAVVARIPRPSSRGVRGNTLHKGNTSWIQCISCGKDQAADER